MSDCDKGQSGITNMREGENLVCTTLLMVDTSDDLQRWLSIGSEVCKQRCICIMKSNDTQGSSRQQHDRYKSEENKDQQPKINTV